MSTTDPKENTTEKGQQAEVQDKPDEQRVKTVTPDNENGDPGPPAEAANDHESKSQ